MFSLWTSIRFKSLLVHITWVIHRNHADFCPSRSALFRDCKMTLSVPEKEGSNDAFHRLKPIRTLTIIVSVLVNQACGVI